MEWVTPGLTRIFSNELDTCLRKTRNFGKIVCIFLKTMPIQYGPQKGGNLLKQQEKNDGADQPAHMHRLISTIDIHY